MKFFGVVGCETNDNQVDFEGYLDHDANKRILKVIFTTVKWGNSMNFVNSKSYQQIS